MEAMAEAMGDPALMDDSMVTWEVTWVTCGPDGVADREGQLWQWQWVRSMVDDCWNHQWLIVIDGQP